MLNLMDLIDLIEITSILQHARFSTTFRYGYIFSAIDSLASVHERFSSGSAFDHLRVLSSTKWRDLVVMKKTKT